MRRLGKLSAKRDRRNLKFRTLLTVLPEIPDAWDVDYPAPVNIPLPTFANLEWGDCVIAGRAHNTLRFEALEQGRLIEISDQEVLEQYWKEGGGNSDSRPDNGLYMLDSLNSWRQEGWTAGGQHYDIYAYAEVNRSKQYEVQAAIYLLNGLYCGFSLPLMAEDQLEKGQCWYYKPGPGSNPGSWGGHCMYLCGYSHIGPTAITWGRKQLMSWEWFDQYCDEAYAVVDNKDRFIDSELDLEMLSEYLRAVTK
ncbi:MAG: hypothetical protein WC749_02020 [Dehalococcoidia bacterium]